LFAIDEWGSDSGFGEKARRRHSEPEPAFISIAASHWQIVVTTRRDQTVAESFQADADGVFMRTLQRRVARATGFTRSTIRQIGRAEKAVEAIGRGVSPPDAALLLGYADQAHLVRSLKRFIRQTPAQVVNGGGHWSVSSPLSQDRLVMGSCRFPSTQRLSPRVGSPP